MFLVCAKIRKVSVVKVICLQCNKGFCNLVSRLICIVFVAVHGKCASKSGVDVNRLAPLRSICLPSSLVYLNNCARHVAANTAGAIPSAFTHDIAQCAGIAQIIPHKSNSTLMRAASAAYPLTLPGYCLPTCSFRALSFVQLSVALSLQLSPSRV